MFAVAAAAVLVPALLLGFPKGNDFEFHLPMWIDIRQQWSEHIFSLRWATLAQYGYGQPIFCFYPPISLVLGAVLSFIVGWAAAPAAYVAVVLLLAGFAMFKLASRFLPIQHALMAALLFECNSYTVFRIYHSSALAESLAGAMLPLLVLFAVDLARGGGTRLFPLAAVFGAVWLTNLPAGIMASYSLAVLLCVLAIAEKSPKVAIRGAGAILLGFGLAAFQLVPGIYEQNWVNVGGLNDPVLLPESNFLLAWGYDADVKWFAAILSCIVVFGIIAGSLTVFVHWRRRTAAQPAFLCATALCLISGVLLFGFSEPAWLYLPKIRLVQFPWRWLLVFQTGFTFMLAAALPRKRNKAWILTIALLAVSLSALALTADYWHPGAGSEIFRRISKDHGYFGRPEYMPPGIDQKQIWPIYDAPPVSAMQKPASIRIEQWTTEDKRFSVASPVSQLLALRLQYYPAWRVEVNGKIIRAAMDPLNGRVLIGVPAGSSSVDVRWVTTLARKLGTAMTSLTLLCFLTAIWRKRHELQKPKPATDYTDSADVKSV